MSSENTEPDELPTPEVLKKLLIQARDRAGKQWSTSLPSSDILKHIGDEHVTQDFVDAMRAIATAIDDVERRYQIAAARHSRSESQKNIESKNQLIAILEDGLT